MRLQALVGIAVASAVSVHAGQTGSTSTALTPTQGTSPYMSGTPSLAGPQVMLVGCLTTGATTFDPFTLASPTLVGTVTPGVTSSTSATSVSLSGGQTTAATSGSLASAGSSGASGTTYSPGTTGTAGTSAGAQGTSAAGSLAGAYPPPPGTTGRLSGGVAASGAAPSAAPAASTMSDVRLRGTGLSTLAGQRVQVVGTLLPGTGAESSMAPGRELRISSIVPIGGTCP